MLSTIEEMKYYLRTAYGDSKNFRGKKVSVKFQGLCQGNRFAPDGWAVISITILNTHKKKRHRGKFVCPISQLTGHLAAILFVDNNNLIHIDMDQDQTAAEAQEDLQASVKSWVNLLIASVGSLKPEKCSLSLIPFVWNSSGKWAYESNELIEEYRLGVPMPDGSLVDIDHLLV